MHLILCLRDGVLRGRVQGGMGQRWSCLHAARPWWSAADQWEAVWSRWSFWLSKLYTAACKGPVCLLHCKRHWWMMWGWTRLQQCRTASTPVVAITSASIVISNVWIFRQLWLHQKVSWSLPVYVQICPHPVSYQLRSDLSQIFIYSSWGQGRSCSLHKLLFWWSGE